MANLIKIKRSTTTATPTSLAEGEIAYSEQSGNLFIGISDNNIANIGGVVGSKIQAYDANTAKLNATTSNFTGTLQNGGSNVLVDNDIGSTVQAYDSQYATKKTQWDTTYSWYQTMTASDDVDSILNTWAELVNSLNNAGESVNILNNGSTIDGGSF